MRLVASPGFQKWAARFPLTRRVTRREGEEIFDLVAGFAHSQCLAALVELGILRRLLDSPASLDRLARAADLRPDRARILLDAGVALGLIRKLPDAYAISRKGAALAGVPGLEGMIRHHRVLYRDLADPVAFFRGESDTELKHFWPYVFGAGAAQDPGTARRYSELMADSQKLVADETLAAVSLSGVSHLMDVGGGTGAFLAEALTAYPDLSATLFDLPAVVPDARARFETAGQSARVRIVPGSFRDQPLPEGADAISLVRVLYDHADETVRGLLAEVRSALPPGGRLIVSEPMAGGARPTRAGDAYFALYTLAMETGRTRSAEEVSALMSAAGFEDVRQVRTSRPFVTSVVTGVRPSGISMSK
ncbi:methyltransferase domain-containing protein [Alphaproteobacteria bacterium GH1-50]|uniref:Methyltransferase domain-containing protein n=1 Tax=Kangsaoukella pontilimi TaxID=2691042 RepID=A0A7C9IKP3_9RHOB|nr:methyltransferase [Kangsaoukella pontilimi]MXQ09762.1 methyltransferase domain-containing protein [Kangsaoukella pontilimi]